MSYASMKASAESIVEDAAKQVLAKSMGATTALRSLSVSVLQQLVSAAEINLGGTTGSEKKIVVMQGLGSFFDSTVGPLINVFLRPFARKAFMFAASIAIDSFVAWANRKFGTSDVGSAQFILQS